MTDRSSMKAPQQQQGQAPARFWALIPCAGVGARAIARTAAGSAAPELPKQYQPVAGSPMVMHTLAAFAGVPRVHHSLVVIAAGDSFWQQLPAADHYGIEACGGATRAETVGNGLKALLDRGAQPQDWVLVHDAARCLVTSGQINALIDACEHDAVGGLLAHQLPDTLKMATMGADGVRVAATVDRSDKWLAQTPQMFRIAVLMDALAKADAAGVAVTDEASAMEAAGLQPKLVAGGAQNFKVTYPDDFALAAAVLLQRQGGLQARH
ncbi:2-C-methyl-D-erythritol 4-phosphate cytidylyltransferase [Comamonas sp.]|uniref:2-C-methyl-D-erythritol 4-phosphate cytidylyltransferase n=1 Tax=Comamonas sp. TaxID=34028 RepID=UPI003A912609